MGGTLLLCEGNAFVVGVTRYLLTPLLTAATFLPMLALIFCSDILFAKSRLQWVKIASPQRRGIELAKFIAPARPGWSCHHRARIAKGHRHPGVSIE